MAKYTLTNKAVEDLGDIWNYTFDRWSELQADKYYQKLIETCQRAADNPKSGKAYEGIHFQLRGIKTGKHIVFFRTLNTSDSSLSDHHNEIEITRILHGRMDLKRRMEE